MATYYSGEFDGYSFVSGASTWSDARGATTGTSYYNTSTATTGTRAQKVSSSSWTIYRSFFPINTSGIDDGASISSATFYMYTDNGGYIDAEGGLNSIIQTTQDPSNLVNDDFNNVIFTSYGNIVYDGFGEIYFSGELSDTSWISKTGTTLLGLINKLDCINSEPTSNNYIKVFFSEDTSGTKDPYLDVTVDEGSSSHSSSSHSSSSHSSSSHSSSSHSSSSHSSSSSETPLKTYTKEDVAALPAADANLAGAFTAQNYTDVATDDDAFVDQTSTGQYAMFLFKDRSASDPSGFTVEWKGKTNLAPSSSTVYLQVYNRTTEEWETVDYDDESNANDEFTLEWSI